jgi:membrane protein required for colicin V production
MVTLDLCLLGLVLLVALAGAVSGALRQVLKLAGVVAGWAAARWLAPLLVRQLEAPSATARALVTAGTFLAAWVLVGWLGRSIRKAVQGEEERPGAFDRLMGALLGAAKGALVAWVFLALLALAGGRLALGSVRIDDRGSRAAALAARHDLLALADPEAAGSLRRLLALWRDPAKRARLLQDPDWKRLMERTGLGTALEKGAGAAGGGVQALEKGLEKARGKAAELLDEKELRRLLDRAEAE